MPEEKLKEIRNMHSRELLHRVCNLYEYRGSMTARAEFEKRNELDSELIVYKNELESRIGLTTVDTIF